MPDPYFYMPTGTLWMMWPPSFPIKFPGVHRPIWKSKVNLWKITSLRGFEMVTIGWQVSVLKAIIKTKEFKPLTMRGQQSLPWEKVFFNTWPTRHLCILVSFPFVEPQSYFLFICSYKYNLVVKRKALKNKMVNPTMKKKYLPVKIN